jgi:hypothetical protein
MVSYFGLRYQRRHIPGLACGRRVTIVMARGSSHDAIPGDVDVVGANGWNGRPRPVFQAYSADTSALDRLDAAHLESKPAADFAILNFAAIDSRHPFLKTLLSRRALLDRYDLKLAAADWFLLQHRTASRYAPVAPPVFSVMCWDEDVLVPQADGMLVMGPRLWLLFRSAAVYSEVTDRSGKKLRWRCVPRNLLEGFLIRLFPPAAPDVEFYPVPNAEPPAKA